MLQNNYKKSIFLVRGGKAASNKMVRNKGLHTGAKFRKLIKMTIDIRIEING
ncbi:hypothetical protein PGT21_015371 [Puccinia graminis f. sp. tritici]|uniref:Uncharacterized protein n=1 Tax=Puccinia graminis f. sp. tritici TaxID=56615 RepID=A0A5B0MWS9_PUCGR|nr:hypothetical protein PGT21_015371 [Puccinia graminis f. sp. tritici]KAA1131594.1 hypothetical protein PGTUg99_032590 [Puccinia graminis f. sp. tritici]